MYLPNYGYALIGVFEDLSIALYAWADCSKTLANIYPHVQARLEQEHSVPVLETVSVHELATRSLANGLFELIRLG